ncbi:MAG: SAM-dependent DNA methyltransferase [Chlorobium sp.]|nr:SAM-dependent DNA methyltransferase [Chlorobium sp.]
MNNHHQLAEFIWKIADHLRGDYQPEDYEKVILPFTLLRRLDCVLGDSHDKVRQQYEKLMAKNTNPATIDKILCRAAGQPFYNRSRFNLSAVLSPDATELGENFDAYLQGFSDNIKDILYNFSGGKEKGLSPIYETLLRKGLLFQVTQAFTDEQVDLSPAKVDNHAMGTVYEHLIHKFKMLKNAAAGAHYTPREVIRLMVHLVFAGEKDRLDQPGMGIGIYDPCCGTGGMLTEAKGHLLHDINAKLDVYLYGQELNEQTYAMAKTDMLMKGEVTEHIKQGNSLSDDKLPGSKFDYMLTNPPFGEDWKKIEGFIRTEAERGFAGRFGSGTPGTNDGSLLFLQHMISKMNPNGAKIAIVFNGSPLFNGDADSGPSNIRRWIIEHDWLDAIVCLPGNLFYQTNITTYIWLLNNAKPVQRRGKVQLINGSGFSTPLGRNLGKKNVEISDGQIVEIAGIYQAFEDSVVCKIFDNSDFCYTKVTVDRPLRLAYEISAQKIADFKETAEYLKLALSNTKDQERRKQAIAKGESRQRELVAALEAVGEQGKIMDDTRFQAMVSGKLSFVPPKGMIKALRSLGERDEEAEIVRNDGEPDADSELRDAEYIPIRQDIDAYFAKEVLPYAPDAWMDRSKDKIGYEINFTKYFYEYQQPTPSKQIAEELLQLEEQTEGLLKRILA